MSDLTSTPNACPACKAEISPAMRFCGSCGSAIPAQTPPEVESSSLTAESANGVTLPPPVLEPEVGTEALPPPVAEQSAPSAVPEGDSARSGPGKGLLVVVAIGLLAVAVVAFVAIKVLGGGAGSRFLAVDSRTGVVMAVGPDKDSDPEDSGISDVAGRVGQYNEDTGEVSFNWVAQVGDQIYAKVSAAGDGAELVRSSIGAKESVSLFQGDATFDAVVEPDGSAAITEYKDGKTSCYLVKDETSPVELASGTTCQFSPDASSVAEIKEKDGSTQVTFVKSDGTTGDSFSLRSADSGSVVISRDLSVIGYSTTSDTGERTGYAVDAAGNPLGNTDALPYLQVTTSGPGVVFQGDASGVASFWAAAQGKFGLVGQGDSGSVTISPSGSSAVVLTVRDERGKLDKVTIGGEAEALATGIKVGSDLTTATDGTTLLVYPGEGSSSYVKVDLNDLASTTLKVRAAAAGIPTTFAAVAQGILLSTTSGDGTEVATSLVNEDGAKVLAEDAVTPIGVDGSRLVYTTSDTVDVIDLDSDQKPQRLLSGTLLTPAFVNDGNLIGTVLPNLTEGDGLPDGDLITVPLDGSSREQVVAPSAVLAGVPGGDLFDGLPTGYFGAVYDAQSLTREEAITQGTTAIGCSTVTTATSPLNAKTQLANECFVLGGGDSVSLSVNYNGPGDLWNSYSGYGSGSLSAIDAQGAATSLGSLYPTEDCQYDNAFNYVCTPKGVSQSFAAPSGTIAIVLLASPYTAATVDVAGSSA